MSCSTWNSMLFCHLRVEGTLRAFLWGTGEKPLEAFLWSSVVHPKINLSRHYKALLHLLFYLNIVCICNIIVFFVSGAYQCTRESENICKIYENIVFLYESSITWIKEIWNVTSSSRKGARTDWRAQLYILYFIHFWWFEDAIFASHLSSFQIGHMFLLITVKYTLL